MSRIPMSQQKAFLLLLPIVLGILLVPFHFPQSWLEAGVVDFTQTMEAFKQGNGPAAQNPVETFMQFLMVILWILSVPSMLIVMPFMFLFGLLPVIFGLAAIKYQPIVFFVVISAILFIKTRRRPQFLRQDVIVLLLSLALLVAVYLYTEYNLQLFSELSHRNLRKPDSMDGLTQAMPMAGVLGVCMVLSLIFRLPKSKSKFLS